MKVCISCQKSVEGRKSYPIKWDRILNTILAIKKALRIAQGNELYVCDDCLQKHQERRSAFERSMVLAGVLAGIIILLILSTIVLGGRFDAFAFFAGVILALVMLLFPLFRYVPALEGMPTKPFAKQFSIPFITKPADKETGKKAADAGSAKPEPQQKSFKPKPRKKKEVL
jgi:hypothetical protein